MYGNKKMIQTKTNSRFKNSNSNLVNKYRVTMQHKFSPKVRKLSDERLKYIVTKIDEMAEKIDA
jgi:hypothetical protein